jgi:hypothetical protein
MASVNLVTVKERKDFRRLISQLDRTKQEKKILKIVDQATNFLHEKDIGWDAVAISFQHDYVQRSKRRSPSAKRDAKASIQALQALNGAGRPGRDGRYLLKKAVTSHPGWELIRTTMGIDIAHITVPDLIAVADLLKIDASFINLFVEASEPTPVEPELPFDEDLEETEVTSGK